jgi:hypothetical protein
VNTHIRHTFQEPTRENLAWLQGFLLRNFLDEDAFRRLKERFPTERLEDRPLFHPTQILNVIRLVLRSCGASDRKPDQNEGDRFKLGAACLMMSDLLQTEEEAQGITQGPDEERMRNLMAQMVSPFEVLNPAKPAHLLFRSYVQFRILLRDPVVRQNISNTCRGFDFARQFEEVAGISLDKWVTLVFAAYSSYLGRSRDQLVSQPELFIINRKSFISLSQVSQAEMDAFLGTVSGTIEELRHAVVAEGSSDPRFDFVPFRAKPLFQTVEENFACTDPAFLLEKIHAGAFWLVSDSLPSGQRADAFTAWGRLFEHYVNWLFQGSSNSPAAFFPFPAWENGGESFDGLFLKESLLVPMEYKGGFLLREAKYAGSPDALIPELERKVVAGCEQLVRKIGQLFDREMSRRKKLQGIPTHHIRRVLPLLIVQDHALGGLFINWWVNLRFSQLMEVHPLAADIQVLPLNLVNIEDIETLVESYEGSQLDFLYVLHNRAIRDSHMQAELQYFLAGVKEYRFPQSKRADQIHKRFEAEMVSYLFGGGRARQKVSFCQRQGLPSKIESARRSCEKEDFDIPGVGPRFMRATGPWAEEGRPARNDQFRTSHEPRKRNARGSADHQVRNRNCG